MNAPIAREPCPICDSVDHCMAAAELGFCPMEVAFDETAYEEAKDRARYGE